ncbi:tRNA threonylcarbamoyl adenosine modification protein, Sua5/YciO/YrdC/YwlC family [Methyloversatilis sp. RAC08]|uniref:L-threonylcarbamoyladenylate synthase n=1 Tax=Methyloversatilis sp. RAC08 TaxID=1842540 RepID=UPI00083E38AF|nr:L-threonylcarbamoyladenylate synthase [Methyloversatilis sp. RAC08]AOF80757.1 tRNA threonylcarbamoyl adenosine modification protein, Sua5/YciO/YrdC/YwlC family [Methyloversatilis sp. RAC08]
MTAGSTDIDVAAERLRAGELVAFPTETVYGLGADALNPDAVRRIFAAKGRPADHPLIVHLPETARIVDWARDIPREAIALANAFWPGPLTLILKRDADVPDEVTGGQDTVGLRVPAHPVALQLLRAFGSGVAAPSANRYGRISPTTAAHVRDEFGDAITVLDGGACEVGIESTILDLSGEAPRILRPGAISAAQIEAVIGRKLATTAGQGAPRASGTLAAHYAPRTPMKKVAGERLRDFLNAFRHSGRRCAVIAHSQPPLADCPHQWSMLPADPEGYARGLYAALREADASGGAMIVIEATPEGVTWAAVNDRLTRALAGAGITPL